MKIRAFILNLLSLLLLAGCKETTIVNELQNTGLIITSIDPEIGWPGMSVEIEGSGFSATAAENIVTFDGIAVTIEAASPTRIISTVPEGVATGPVNVQVGEETAVGPVFTLDERLAFVGEYRVQDYEMRITETSEQTDTTLSLEAILEIDISLFGDDSNGIKIDIKEFVEEGLKELYLVLGIEYSGHLLVLLNQPVAMVRGDEFKFSTINFEITNGNIRILGEFTGSGGLIDGEAILLRFVYAIVGGGVTYSLEGEAVLQKQ